MSKKMKIVLYVVLMTLFVVYLFFSNSIVEHIFKIKQEDYLTLSPISFSSIPNVTTPMVYIDSASYSGDITESFFVKGWGFCETSSDNSNKSINAVFKDTSSDKAYICRANAQIRDDVYNAFCDTKNIYNDINGIYAKFPTYIMPIGDYELYINVEESETDYGIASTGKVFRKTANDFYELTAEAEAETGSVENAAPFISERAELSAEGAVSEGKGYIDIIQTDSEGFIYISGWASCSSETNNEQVIYIGLTDENGSTAYYTTMAVNREDVAAALGDPSYRNCGFDARVSADNMSGVLSINILGEANGTYYQVPFNGQNIVELVSEEPDAPALNETVELKDIAPEPKGISWIDRVTISDGVLSIEGWGSVSAETNETQVLYIKLMDINGNERIYSVNSVDRQDIVNEFADPSYLKCGFHAYVDSADISPDTTITVIAQTENGCFETVTNR